MEAKVCNKCKQAKPLTEFSKQKDAAQGVKGRCKKCEADDQAKRRGVKRRIQKNQSVPTDITPTKECPVCREWKPLTAFYKLGGDRFGEERKPACAKCDYARKVRVYGESFARDTKRVWAARKLGLSVDDYLSLIAEDCHACGAQANRERQNNVYVNRRTGVITGVVCKPCSLALGLAGHDPDRLKALAALAAYSIEYGT